jgi:hypothetical protein
MRVLTNKSGIGLSAVLGIILFVISSTVIVITSVYGSSIAVEGDYKANQEYVNAQNNIDVTANIIMRDEDLSAEFLVSISAYMDLTIVEYNDGIYMISKELSNGRIVSSYITGSASDITAVNMGDTVFDITGIESAYDHDVLLEPAVILSSYLSEFMPNTFSSLGYDENFSDFDSIFTYFETLADDGSTYTEVSPNTLKNMSNPTVGGHWYVTGNLTIDDNDDLIIPDGYVLFVDGNLEMGTRSLLEGTVVVNGKVKFDTNNTWGDLEATVYCSGKFVAEKTLYLGYSYRPAFVFADGIIDLNKYVYGYGYFYSASEFEVNRRGTSISITGGAYSPDTNNLSSYEIYENSYLDEEDLYDMGVPSIVSIIDDSDGTSYFYTSPK